MRFAVPRHPDAASLPRRAAAGAIDLALISVSGGALFGAAAGVAAATGRSLSRWIDRSTESEVWSHAGVYGALASLQLTGRNWRSPGMRAVGIRRVDARTRGPVSVRSAYIGLGLQTANQRISKVLLQPTLARAQARQLAANDEIERMRASRPDHDAEELWRDGAAIRKRLGARNRTWMLPRMLVRIAVEHLPALFSSSRQTLTQRLTGTADVLDR
jgi:RDD family